MRKIRTYRYVFAGLITIGIFLLGLFMGHYLDNQRYAALESRIEKNTLDLQSKRLQLSYLQSDHVRSCDALRAGFRDIVAAYNDRLRTIESYQDESVFSREEFEGMKRAYVLSGIRYWMFAQQIRKKCGRKTDTVLYFTSKIGTADDCAACGKMGEQLRLLKKEYDGRLLIFPVISGIEDGLIDMIEAQYGVDEIPTVVVNGNASKKLVGAAPRDTIRALLTVSTP